MLFRKIRKTIANHLSSGSDKILLVEGARQVGKSYIIRNVGEELFPNFIELNFVKDNEGLQIFKNVRSVEDFYLLLSSMYGSRLGDCSDTLIFLDEIQEYPQYITWLKFLREDRRYSFIASGSFLGLSLRDTTSLPVGSVVRKEMYPLDFEEFLIANDFGADVLAVMKQKFLQHESVMEGLHNRVMDLFRRYLLVGGMPDAVNAYIGTHNMSEIRQVQEDIHRMYLADASKYEEDYGKRLRIRRIYEMLPSQMENKKKRLVAKEIDDRKGARFSQYREEFEYLLSSGIALGVDAISNPKFPLVESLVKNLVKLYMNDVGMLTNLLFRYNVAPVLNDERSVNLGSVYESVVAQELQAHGHRLFYYDNRKVGEVDFIINDYATLSPLPVEVKSGKDYTVHSALTRFLSVKDYGIDRGIVFSNTREVSTGPKGIVYMPVYYVMFLDASAPAEPLLI
ncbi:ATP-binding protein [Lepagella muris]|jgi:hypothetical protein|uniref:ATP-binding protein n=1 Tax=Lepagella muris TaxID=3032870 RepID=A0AC61RF99_9BACT|nr:AAA family ATPase [Lepagella muris]ROT02215.1 ATP-binding protein [Muribaculaceae bacterium Isolate-037 (Harlan)]TGY79343.1 ATP-binding protein [Lepagella muris]THG52610.1 ATP-binding protein [Bacteroidales bacterium]TKC62906.1 ATP-binding protein [Bacteroidales bacterium]